MKRISLTICAMIIVCIAVTAVSEELTTDQAVCRARLSASLHEVTATRMILELLREKKTDEAIGLLECQLDCAVVIADHLARKREPTNQNIMGRTLQRAKEYRVKYPRQTANPTPTGNAEFDQMTVERLKKAAESAKTVLSQIDQKDLPNN